MKLPVWAVGHEIQNVITEVIVFSAMCVRRHRGLRIDPLYSLNPHAQTHTRDPELDEGHSLHEFKAGFFLITCTIACNKLYKTDSLALLGMWSMSCSLMFF